jgi:hypothetical protein
MYFPSTLNRTLVAWQLCASTTIGVAPVAWWFIGEDKDWTTIIQQSKEKHKGKTLNEHESKKKHPSLF